MAAPTTQIYARAEGLENGSGLLKKSAIKLFQNAQIGW